MSSNNRHPLEGVPRRYVLLATGMGIGLIPFAPGTCAAVVACLLWIALSLLLPATPLLVATIVFVIAAALLGAWVEDKLTPYWGADSRVSILDECLGTWVALLAVQYVSAPTKMVLLLAGAALVLYRIIDIWKPLGCRWIDRNMHGGGGAVADDLLAGVYAALIIVVLRVVLHV